MYEEDEEEEKEEDEKLDFDGINNELFDLGPEVELVRINGEATIPFYHPDPDYEETIYYASRSSIYD